MGQVEHDGRLRCARLLAGVLVFLGATLLVTAPVGAGFSGRKSMGEALTATESDRVQDAIDAIITIAELPRTGAKNQATLENVAKCLQALLDGGMICREGASDPNWDAMCGNDLKKGWSGDAININPRLLKSGEVPHRGLAAALVHEGIHAMQCSDNRNRREWSAYSWEVYVLDKWDNDAFPRIPIGESEAAFDRHRDFKASRRDAYCDAYALDVFMEEIERLAQRMDLSVSAVDPDRVWYTRRTAPNAIELFEASDGDDTPLRAISSSFAQVTAVRTALTLDGREVLYVCGTDAGATAGGVERFVDLDGDGLVDQTAHVVVAPAGTMALPFDVALDAAGGAAYVLDIAAAGTTVRVVRDLDGDGLIDALQPAPFMTSDVHAFLPAMQSVDVAGPDAITLSAWAPGQSYLEPNHLFYDAVDVDGDGMADLVSSGTRLDFQLPSRPVFVRDLQPGDPTVTVWCAPGTTLEIWTATPEGALIDLLGLGPALAADWRQVVGLDGPVPPGTWLVARAVDHDVPDGPPTPVVAHRPEIFDVSAEVVLAGQDVVLTGRNLHEDAVVICGDVAVSPRAATGNELIFTAPDVLQIPNGFVTVEVVDGAGAVSSFVGLQIDGDCDGDGISDLETILNDPALDANGNNILDGCESGCPDFDGDGMVGLADLLAVLSLWGPCEGCPEDVDVNGFVGFADLLTVLAAWGACG